MVVIPIFCMLDLRYAVTTLFSLRLKFHQFCFLVLLVFYIIFYFVLAWFSLIMSLVVEVQTHAICINEESRGLTV